MTEQFEVKGHFVPDEAFDDLDFPPTETAHFDAEATDRILEEAGLKLIEDVRGDGYYVVSYGDSE